MPVWHEKTKAWRESGKLAVVGITQEQHPERCRLFAQWHGIDWPILWDPFNVTESKAVPRFTLIDEHGVVRSRRPTPKTIEESFLDKTFDKPAGNDPAPTGARNTLVAQHTAPANERVALACLAALLWRKNEPFPNLKPLEDLHLAGAGARPEHRFWLGVALCMRHEDTRAHERGDFDAALARWHQALSAHPSQYIWRRRIQQFGPRMDKPYPFYDWVAAATERIRSRGEEPVALRVALTRSEVASRRETNPDTTQVDPEGKVPRLTLPFDVEFAYARATKQGASTTQVHLFVYPPKTAKWDLDARPPTLWTGSETVRAHAVPNRLGAWRFEFERPFKPQKGYALLSLCLNSGECAYLRWDVALGSGGIR